MSLQEHLNIMKGIQESIHDFLEDKAQSDVNFEILEDKFKNSKICENKYDFLSLLHLISKIVNNFHRVPDIFIKIEKILHFFNDDIKKYFSNSEIFNIFKSNKRILLFLIEQQIIVIDEYIVKKITTTEKFIEFKYPQYFQPEIQPFINEQWFPKYDPERKVNGFVEDLKKELPENFYEKRKEGENDSQICELIRKDMITDFVAYVTRNNVSLDAEIQPSIYETNSFLLKRRKPQNCNGFSLIEYAVFFGSIQIFNYLRHEGAKLESSLWPLSIHGQNAGMIHFLEDNHVELEDNSYSQVFHESIKCHHNDIANYFINNFLQNDEENSQDTFNQSLKYYNFAFLKNEFIGESSFFSLCKYDYCRAVDNLLKDNTIDVNEKEIFNILLI